MVEGSALEIYVHQYAPKVPGFERVFRYPSYAGVDVISYYENGIVDPTKDIRSSFGIFFTWGGRKTQKLEYSNEMRLNNSRFKRNTKLTVDSYN